MRVALDGYTRGTRPAIETSVEKIGLLRNKTATE